MDISKMINFCTIVECGNISKASEKLFCSQPALSKQITSIENELGYTLFIRNGKKLLLNENGEIFYRFAKNMINDYTLLKRELFIKNNSTKQEIRFGTTNYIGTYLLPPVIGRFKTKRPTTPVNFMVNFLPNIMELLDKDIINFAIIPVNNEILADSSYKCEPFLEDEFALVLPNDHPLNEKEKIYAEDLSYFPFLISQEQSATRQFILSSFDSYNIKLNNLIDMHNTNTIRESVVNGLGITILSKKSIQNHERLGLLKSREISNMPLVRKLYLVHKVKHTLLEEEAVFMKQFIVK